MIVGHNREFYIIGASNLPGYDPYLTADFTKAFLVGEDVTVFYPPEHPQANSQYEFDSLNSLSAPFTFIGEQARIVLNQEGSILIHKPDYVMPYQTNLVLKMKNDTNSPFPLNDAGYSGGSGFDAFFIKGSVFKGVQSGARRYYSGPFKGYTKESECVCEGTTATNELDRSDCRGWLKGSIYEIDYDPNFKELFNYVGEPKENVDHRQPFNDEFLTGTPFDSIDYTWCNIPYRQKRPVPYNKLSDNKGNYAVLIGKKHALISSTTDIDTDNLRFYSESQGLTTAQVAHVINSFQELWDACGFIPLGNNQTSLASYAGMSSHFDGIKMVKFTKELPSDIAPVSLYDPVESDPIYYALALGQDGRGHVGVFCPPLAGENTTGKATITFTKDNECNSFPQPLVIGGDCCGTDCKNNPRITRSLLLDGLFTDYSVGAVLAGDMGGPVITYWNDRPVFLGFMKEKGYEQNAYAKMIGVGLGSSKKYEFHWGTSFGLIDLLNLYMALTGNDFLNTPIKTKRNISEEKYPYPIGFLD
jgi:hypothetical protein